MGLRRPHAVLLVVIGMVVGAIAVTPLLLLRRGDDVRSAQVSSGPSTTKAPTTTVAPPSTGPTPTTTPTTAPTVTSPPTTTAPAAPKPCEPSSFAATLTPDKPTYTAGDMPQFKASFRNTSGRTCTAAQATVALRLIDSNGQPVATGASSRDVPLDPAEVRAGETVTLTQRLPALPRTTGAYVALFDASPLGTARAVIRVVTPDERAAPPDAVLTAASGEVVGARGSFCWHAGMTGLCVDTDGFPEGAETLSVRRGEPLTLSFVGGKAPTELIVTRSGSSGPELQRIDLQPANTSQFQADFPTGTWWLFVLTRWAEGDGSHYFRIDVR